MPTIILGGIIAGVMTPTEAACAGATYAFVLGFFVYGELKLRDLPKIITESVAGTAAVAIIISAAQPMGWILTYEQAPLKVLALFQDTNFPKAALLLIVNVIMLILGCFLEGLAVMVMAVPVLMPLLRQAGIEPLHFGVLFVLNIMIGTNTPPVGTIMYVVCALGKISIAEFRREVWPFPERWSIIGGGYKRLALISSGKDTNVCNAALADMEAAYRKAAAMDTSSYPLTNALSAAVVRKLRSGKPARSDLRKRKAEVDQVTAMARKESESSRDNFWAKTAYTDARLLGSLFKELSGGKKSITDAIQNELVDEYHNAWKHFGSARELSSIIEQYTFLVAVLGVSKTHRSLGVGLEKISSSLKSKYEESAP